MTTTRRRRIRKGDLAAYAVGLAFWAWIAWGFVGAVKAL